MPTGEFKSNDSSLAADPAKDASQRVDASALTARAALMSRLADQAGVIAMRHFQSQTLGVDTKSDASPVTEADLAIETMLRADILAAFGSDALLGEEHGEQPGESGWRWVIDPIDGTVSFATGVPLFGTLIGLENRGVVMAGMCDMPALNERVWAVRGGGAWWQRSFTGPGQTGAPEPARVRPCARLSDALICTSGLEYYERARATDALVRVARASGRMRGWSDCYGGLLVATGRADGWVDPVMHAWDSAPFPVILEEAGGVFSDWSGHCDIRGGNVIAAGARVHAELASLVKKQSP